MIFQLLLLQVVIPGALLGWLFIAKDRRLLPWLLREVAVGCYLVAIASAGLWTTIPPHLLLLYIGLFLFASIQRRPGGAGDHPARSGMAVLRLIVNGVVAAGMLLLMVQSVLGRRPASAVPIVELELPLRSGPYYVANGGSRELINAHLMTLRAPRSGAYRGQSYGLDLLGVGRGGLRAAGISPSDPSQYEVFGDSVYAPCGGATVRALDGLEDLSPPEVDQVHMEGNHAILDCGGVWILLAHLKRGSVLVESGDTVQAGEVIGAVGSTGNSDEPHLHIHAQRPRNGGGAQLRRSSPDPVQRPVSGSQLHHQVAVGRAGGVPQRTIKLFPTLFAARSRRLLRGPSLRRSLGRKNEQHCPAF